MLLVGWFFMTWAKGARPCALGERKRFKPWLIIFEITSKLVMSSFLELLQDVEIVGTTKESFSGEEQYELMYLSEVVEFI